MVTTVSTLSIQKEVDNLIFRYINSSSSNGFLKQYLSLSKVTPDQYREEIWIDFPPYDAEGRPHFYNREAYSMFRHAWDSVTKKEQEKIFPARFSGYKIFIRSGSNSIKIRSGCLGCSLVDC